jgi:ribosomal protein S18 acetylase RimI-like enzyme
VGVRGAELADVPALARLNAEVQALHRARRPDRYRDPSLPEIEGWFRTMLATEGVAILVATDGEAVVGYALVRTVASPGNVFAYPQTTAHLDQLGVAGGHQRAGHGRALIAAVEAQGRAWGAAAVQLDVQAINPEAARFYAALGYVATASRLARPL